MMKYQSQLYSICCDHRKMPTRYVKQLRVAYCTCTVSHDARVVATKHMPPTKICPGSLRSPCTNQNAVFIM